MKIGDGTGGGQGTADQVQAFLGFAALVEDHAEVVLGGGVVGFGFEEGAIGRLGAGQIAGFVKTDRPLDGGVSHISLSEGFRGKGEKFGLNPKPETRNQNQGSNHPNRDPDSGIQASGFGSDFGFRALGFTILHWMPRSLPTFRSHVTLGLTTILHGFTHAYGSMLVPLYFLMVADLHLSGVRLASLIVTIYGGVYFLGSYAAGVMSDRFDRKVLLGIGLLGNAAAIIAMGLTHDYAILIALGVAAGIFGTLFHPAANALAPSHYPNSPGMAIGLLGAGSGLGFFFGPLIAGWRTHASWNLWTISSWQKPCIELGAAGFIMGIIFLIVANNPPNARKTREPAELSRSTRWQIARIAIILGPRDFCGIAIISLASIYLQRVYHVGVAEAGRMVGMMMLPSVAINPLAVYLSPGKRRLPGLAIILISGGLIVTTTPFWGAAFALPVMCAFQTLQMASYAVSDAAMLERVAPDIRGRVVGIFLLIAGTIGSLGPWVMGAWTDWLGKRATEQLAYIGPFSLLGVLMVIAAMSPRWLGKLGPAREGAPISPMEEIAPATLG
jgi:MFS family permease